MKINKFKKLPLNFVFVDENTGREYRLNDLNCTEDQFFEWLETFNYDKLEITYGIHDFSGGETDIENIVGFSSYEISNKDFVTVMEIWRKGLVDAGFISPDKEVEIVDGENINPVIIFYNSLTDYTEKYEIERIGLEQFKEDYADDFTGFIEPYLTSLDCNEFDGNEWTPSGCFENGNEYNIQIDSEESNWREILNKVIQKVIEYFEEQGIDLNKID